MYMKVTGHTKKKLVAEIVVGCKENIKETKIETKEHNNRQSVNIYVRNLDTNKER